MPRYEVEEMHKGCGIWLIRDADGRPLYRQWPQNRILRTWKSEKAAAKTARLLEARSEPLPS
jgi:hypothetical protein